MEQKIEKCTYTVNRVFYVCKDGREFDTREMAQLHEDSLWTPRKIEEYYLNLEGMEVSGLCYKITEEDDLNYLQAKEWGHYATFDYIGPGWYFAIFHDGGDYHDSYEVVKIDQYKAMLENDLKEIQYLTSD